MATFASLRALDSWHPIPRCPGRWVWRGAPNVDPTGLLGLGVAVRVFSDTSARDVVHVAFIEGGGLISYRRPDGSFVHTLNDADGLWRKLRQLGIEPPE